MDSSSQKDYELLLVLITLPEQYILAASAWQCHTVKAECVITKPAGGLILKSKQRLKTLLKS